MVLAALQPQYEGHVYFETSCMILTFVCGGKYLEAKAKARTSDVVGALLGLAAKTAILVSPSDTAGDMSHQQLDREVPLEQVQKGDLLKVLPGATVPTDGVVVSGTSAVDEALVTGEPLPVTKVPGGQLIGGTINTTGMLIMQATQVGLLDCLLTLEPEGFNGRGREGRGRGGEGRPFFPQRKLI
jgi:Cu+-exporting ATPase